MKEWIYSRNAVYECLRARRRQPFRLRVAQGVEEKGRLVEILHLAAARKVVVERVPRQQLDSLAAYHQGVALEASAYPYAALADILSLASQRGEPPFVLVLDVLQDPQNLGTLLRTAEAVGVHGILLPLRHTATITPAVVNASSGASEHLCIAQANLAQAIVALKEAGLWVIGLEAGPEAQPPGQVRLDGALALVVGGEGSGMRDLVRKSCDLLLRLPMRGQVESLNAAVAGSIALYLAHLARTIDVSGES
ncbi:MAG: 23S rRNA (guanosine(2251)-2'-O)-methyltransferase RlmB [Anaerolineales bacterium]|nr:23S rRNA (guanosine(2251)-2'-O)-methyltransferase RlmB [Anaerolineales bacterium]